MDNPAPEVDSVGVWRPSSFKFDPQPRVVEDISISRTCSINIFHFCENGGTEFVRARVLCVFWSVCVCVLESGCVFVRQILTWTKVQYIRAADWISDGGGGVHMPGAPKL